MSGRQCRHAAVVRVSSHFNLSAAAASGEPMASRYTCARPECIARAKAWIAGQTGATAVVVPLPMDTA